MLTIWKVRSTRPVGQFSSTFRKPVSKKEGCPTRECDRPDELSQGSDERTLDDMDPTMTMDPLVSFSNMILAASLAQ